MTFVVVGGDIFFFTGPGLKLTAARERRSVAFQTDDIYAAAKLGWSLLAVGPATLAGSITRERVEALGLCPWAAAERHRLVRARPEFLSGRRILGPPHVPPARTGKVRLA